MLQNYGRYLVLKEYRGQGIMYNLQRKLIDEAKSKDIDYLIATVHPNNIASKKTISKVGFINLKNNILIDKYIRDIYYLNLRDIECKKENYKMEII